MHLCSLCDTDGTASGSYILSHTLFYICILLIKLTKPGLLGETVAGEIQGGVLGRATLMGLDATRDLVIYARSCYYMLHDT